MLMTLSSQSSNPTVIPSEAEGSKQQKQKMKRITNILLLTATLLMTGCGGHSPIDPDPVRPSGQYIFFDAGVLETKGLLEDGPGLSTAAGTDFGVFGYRPSGEPIFTTYTDMQNVARVYRATDAAAFSYTDLALWHPGAHDFYAFYPYDKAIVTEAGVDNNQKPYIKYTQPQTLDGMYDLMTAKAENVESSTSSTVNLTFDHRLFALDFEIKNSQTVADLTVTRAEIKFFNVANQVTLYYDGTANVISVYKDVPADGEAFLGMIGAGNEVTIDPGTTHNFNKIAATGKFNSFLFLPCTALNVQIKLTFVNAWGQTISPDEPLSMTLKPKDENGNETAFLAGYKYKLTLNKSDDSITFDPIEPSNWESRDIPLTFN